MSCGGAIALTRLGIGYEIRINWLTGGVEVVPRRCALSELRATDRLHADRGHGRAVGRRRLARGDRLADRGDERGVRAVGYHMTLVETARTIVTGLPDRDDLMPGILAGEVGGHRWRVDVLPFYADSSIRRDVNWIPQSVVLRVQSPTGPILQVNTVRLRRGPG